jgi:hypothetical protein
MGPIARIATSAAAALAATAASAPLAGAAEVTLDRRCYAEGDVITQTGAGFAAAAQVSERLTFASLAGDPLGSLSAPAVTADTDGAFTRRIGAPGLRRDSHRREKATSTFSDQAGGEPATVRWTLTGWAIEVAGWTGGKATKGRRIRVDTWGWTDNGRRLFVHYFRAGQKVKTQRIGRLRGPCRDLEQRVRSFDFAGARPGAWKVYFSATRRLDRQADAWFSYDVTVVERRKKKR